MQTNIRTFDLTKKPLTMDKNFAGAKGRFIQNKMNQGYTKKAAHNVWKKSDEKKEWDKRQWDKLSKDHRSDTSNIDRSYGSPWQDWAASADDF